MTWFNKAKDSINKGMEDVKVSLEESVEEAKQNSKDAVEKLRIQDEKNKKLQELFKVKINSRYIQADIENKLWRLTTSPNNIYDFTDLVSYELLENKEILTSGGLGVGRAVVGNFIAGPIGAVLGGLSKKKKASASTNDLQIRISNSANRKQTMFITLLKKETKHKSRKYRNAIESARETLDILDLIADEAENNIEVTPAEDNSLNKIRQLKDLLDDEIITQEEFDEKKKQLLG